MKLTDITLADVSVETKVETLGVVLDKKLSEIDAQVSTVSKLIGPQGPKGDKGDKGAQGPAGVAGKDGKDGRDGKDGKAGKDGDDGKAGISVVGASVALDGSLVLDLSNGSQIDAGEVVGPAGPSGMGGPQGLQGPAGVGIATGGTTGQVLAKVDDTDYNTEWITVSGGGAVDSVNGYTGTVVLTASDVGAEPADATILKDADIGVTVQGYNANTVIDASYVHTDNNYTTTEKSKLAGIATGAEVNVNADWSAVSGDAQILNKPALFSGAYNDLTGKPTLGTAAAQDTTAFATAAQGALADTAVQPADIADFTTVAEIASISGDLHGVVDRTASSISFNESTRTLTIAPTGSSWTFYYHGVLYTVSSSKTVTIANTSGSRFIKIDPSTLALVEGGAVPDFAADVVLCYIYWNATTGKAMIVGDERHGSKRDTTWHSNQHLNVGTVWRSGGSLSYTLNNASSVTLEVGTPLVIADEDLTHSITNSASPSADYQQILSPSASLEVLYLDGTAYAASTASTSPWIAGTSFARYNQITGGSGSLVDAAEGDYISYWLLATNDIRRPVKLVLGRNTYTSLDAAYAEAFEEYGLSFAEQVFMYQIVVKTSASYTANSAKIVIAGVRKINTKVANTSSTIPASQHNSLTGRDTVDSHPIGAITNLQTTLDGKQATLVSGTNIKTVNSTSLLGSGNVAVQETLVSGTNIKTINGTSVLGSGDIAITGGSGTVTSVSGTGTVSGISLSGTVTTTGSLTLSGTLSATASNISDFSTAADARIAAASIDALSDVVITTPSNTQVLTYNGTNWVNAAAPSGGGGSLTSSQASLATDVQMPTSNTWYDGPSLSLGAGTWLINTHTTLARTATTALTYFNRVTTGTVHYASSSQYQASVANHTVSIGLSAVITLASTTTIKIQSTSNAGATSVLMKAATLANGSGNNATQITAVKIA